MFFALRSTLKHGKMAEPLTDLTETVMLAAPEPEAAPVRRYLFTTKTCPNCRAAKEFLKDQEYEVIDAEENVEMVRRYGIMQAPTRVVDDGREPQVFINASNIRSYAQSQGAAV